MLKVTGDNELKNAVIGNKQSYLTANRVCHIAEVVFSFVIFKMRDLVVVKDNDKKA